jgi:hypothetical protein
MKPCEPTKMAKEDLFLASGRSNNEYLGSVIRLFQTVSEGEFSETHIQPVASLSNRTGDKRRVAGV